MVKKRYAKFQNVKHDFSLFESKGRIQWFSSNPWIFRMTYYIPQSLPTFVKPIIAHFQHFAKSIQNVVGYPLSPVKSALGTWSCGSVGGNHSLKPFFTHQNTSLSPLKEFDYKTTCPPTMLATGSKSQKFCLIVSSAMHLSIKFNLSKRCGCYATTTDKNGVSWIPITPYSGQEWGGMTWSPFSVYSGIPLAFVIVLFNKLWFY